MAPVINPPVQWNVRTRFFTVWECLIVTTIPLCVGTRPRESTNHSQSEFWIIFAHCTALLLLKFWASRSCLDSVYANRLAVNKLRIIAGLWTMPGPRQCGEHALIEDSARRRRNRKNTSLGRCLMTISTLKNPFPDSHFHSCSENSIQIFGARVCEKPIFGARIWEDPPTLGGGFGNLVSKNSGPRRPMIKWCFPKFGLFECWNH